MKDPNQNRQGYKQTKAGWIPVEWTDVILSSVAEIRTGLAKGKDVVRSPVSMPYLRVANVQDGYVDLAEIKNIAVEAVQVARYSLRANDVLFTEGGDFDKLGRGCVWNGQVTPCLHQNHVFAVRCDTSKLMPNLLALVAAGPHGRRYFTLNSKQSTNLASINSTQLKEFPIPVPPLPEQKKIAEILSTCDGAIDRTSELIAAKKRQKNALMQQLLTGKKRLPGFTERWSHHQFGDLFERVTRKNQNGCGNVLTISGALGLVSQAEYFNKRIAGKDLSGYFLLKSGELAYNKSYCNGYPLGAIKMLERYEEGVVSTLYICFRLRDRSTYAPFVRHFFESSEFNRELYTIAQEGARNHGLLNVTPDEFFSTRLCFPPFSEQQAIAEVLSTAGAEIALLEQKHASFQQLKKGLMQKLLTGQVRVNP